MAGIRKSNRRTIRGRYDAALALSADQAALLDAVRALFASLPDYGSGADFRVAFLAAAMDGYCDHCGSGGPGPCYCTRDD